MLNYQFQIMGDEFVTSNGHEDEFNVNLLFDRSIYRPICTHMGHTYCRAVKTSRVLSWSSSGVWDFPALMFGNTPAFARTAPALL